jgi:hypothetical protein
LETCQGNFIVFNAFIQFDFQRLCQGKNSNSFLEARYWNLKLALQTGAANWLKKIVQDWMPFSKTSSGSQSTSLNSDISGIP